VLPAWFPVVAAEPDEVVPDPLVLVIPDVFCDPAGGVPLGLLLGDELAGGDDAGGSADGDGDGEAEPVACGGGGVAVRDDVGQWVDFGLAAAVVVALAAEPVVVGVAVAAAEELTLPLAGVSGVALGLSLGLPVPADGEVGGGVGRVVAGVAELLGLADFGVPGAFGLAGGQDAAGAGPCCPVLVLVIPTPVPFGWPPPRDPLGRAELVVPEPVTVAVSWLISWPSGVSANTSATTNTAQAMPKAGRSSASRQSPRPSRPRRASARTPDTPEENARAKEAKERPPAWAGTDRTRARIRSRPSGRGSIWSATECSSRRRNSGKSCPEPSGPWPDRVMSPAPGRRAAPPSRGRCGS
jgi:hypothetical protein